MQDNGSPLSYPQRGGAPLMGAPPVFVPTAR